jgi:hypothetical protein
MIEATLTLEEEAQLYADAFFHKKDDLPTPEVIHSAPLSRSQSSTQMSKCICYRCGSVGHMSSSCTNPLIPVEELEQEVNADIQKIIDSKRNAPNMQSDEFGLFCDDGKSAVPPDQSWKTTTFCTNCGEAGHRERECRHKTFNEIANRMRDCLAPHSRHSSAEIENFFRDLWQ